MAGQTRIFGLGVTAGTLYSHNASGFKLTVQNNSNSNIDLRAEDDAIDEAVEEIIGELNPLMYFVVNDNSGVIHLIMDKNHTAADIQQRVRNLGSAVGPNNIDVRGSDCVAASSITVA